MKKVTVSLLVLLSLFSLFDTQLIASENNLLGKTAPAFTLKDLDGNNVSLSDFKGNVIILNFWATWCPPCIREIPDFIKLYSKYKDNGFVMIGLSVDQGGISKVKAFKQKININYPILMADINVSDAYGNINSIPTTFVIGTDGKIKRVYTGYRTKNVFETDIQKLLPNLNLQELEKEMQAQKSQYVEEINKIGIAGRLESENAAPYYRKAIELYAKAPEELNEKSKRFSEDLTTKEKELIEKWLQDNEPALKQIELGSKKDYCWFTQKGPTIESNPLLMNIRDMFLVLQARIYQRAENGNINSVIDDIITSYKFGIHISDGPKPLDEKMVGTAIKNSSIRTAFYLINKKALDLKSITALENRLEPLIEKQNETFDIRGEKLLTLEKVSADTSNDFYRQYLKDTLEFLDTVSAMSSWKLHNEKEALVEKSNPWIKMLAPTLERIIEIENLSKIETKALITTLSILRYNSNKGRYPATLSQLVSEGYIEELPIDPFSNKPLVYRTTKEGFILYSYGTDFDDDGGQNSKLDNNNGDQVFWPVEQNP